MAALGKIRSKGMILACIIGLALFAFIAEELVRSCESTKNESQRKIGEVLGHRIDYETYQSLVEEYQEVMKFTQGRDNLTDAELNNVKDAAWRTLVQGMIMEDECGKAGLTVTDAELQTILAQGTHQMLLETPFVNQQTGRFDANLLKKFIAEYKQAETSNPQLAEQYRPLYRFWNFVEKSLRMQLLTEKYQTLLASCFLANPVSAKAAYDDAGTESTIVLASLPYASVNDNDVTVGDADLKAKYNAYKSVFRRPEETRDIKYVSYIVTASEADRKALDDEISAAAEKLSNTDDPADVVRKAVSQVAYIGLPQNKKVFSADIAAMIDSTAVGQTSLPKENKRDNTLNVVKVIARQTLPDSIEFRAIRIAEVNIDDSRNRADSIFDALRGGADFEAIAKKYGQTGEKTWMTGEQYEHSTSMDKDSRTYITTLNSLAAGEIKNIEMANGNIVVQVTDRRAFVEKYDVAVIKRQIDFSKDTYSAAYNKFSRYVSEARSVDDMIKGAEKYGYKVIDRPNMSSQSHYIANIQGTHDGVKWVFGADEGDISPLYECGNNDCLLVVMMTRINKKGYGTLEEESIGNYVRSLVVNDKKAEKLMAEIEGVKNIDEAKAKGARIDTVKQITFAAPVHVQATATAEPALSGAVAATDKGAFCKAPVKGSAGVYLFSVVDKTQREGTEYNEQDYEQRLQNKAMQYAGGYMQQLIINANITDNRYLFF